MLPAKRWEEIKRDPERPLRQALQRLVKRPGKPRKLENLLDAALADEILHRTRDVYNAAAVGYFEPEILR